MEQLIVVVDDERSIADLTAHFLEREGYCCRALYDASDAVAALQSSQVALIVSDINMPGVSGIELASHARHHCPKTKVLLMSGGETSQSIAQKSGCEGCEFLAKPFGKRELLNAVETMLNSDKARNRRTVAATDESAPPTINC